MQLTELVRSDAKIQEIGYHLDQLKEAARVREIYSLDGANQKRLYEKAGDSANLSLEHFVPLDTADHTQVVHYGKNSQPAFRFFEKRWLRPALHQDQLWGYNELPVRHLIGPGYFVAHNTTGSEGEGVDHRGAVVLDYFMLPEGPMPPNWPSPRPNSRGLQMFIYDKTRDYMRGVSKHVSIGVAYRMETRVMGYFVLCRAATSSY